MVAGRAPDAHDHINFSTTTIFSLGLISATFAKVLCGLVAAICSLLFFWYVRADFWTKKSITIRDGLIMCSRSGGIQPKLLDVSRDSR
jgi:hypothetical protein